jgi:hypothetical protein
MKFIEPTIVAAAVICTLIPAAQPLQNPAANQLQPVVPKTPPYIAATRDNYRKLADEVETALHRDVLDVWFPRTVDNVHGGFRSDFTRDWQPGAQSGGKFSVFQDA